MIKQVVATNDVSNNKLWLMVLTISGLLLISYLIFMFVKRSKKKDDEN